MRCIDYVIVIALGIHDDIYILIKVQHKNEIEYIRETTAKTSRHFFLHFSGKHVWVTIVTTVYRTLRTATACIIKFI